MTLQRRDVLRTATTLPLLAIAGCSGVFATEDGPAYGDDLPRDGANDTEGVFFVHIDAEWLRSFDGEDLPYGDALPDAIDVDLEPDDPAVAVDPLIAYPVAGLLVGALGFAFGLLPYGFADEVLAGLDEGNQARGEPADGTTADGPVEDDIDRSVRIDSMLLVDGVGVFQGDFDGPAIVAASAGFEPAGGRDGFDIYEGTGAGVMATDGLRFAVRDDMLMTMLDADASLDAVIDATAGSGNRLGDGDDAGWALAEAGHGHVTLGAWGVDPDRTGDEMGIDHDFAAADDVYAAADGLVSSFTFGPEEGRGTIAAVFPAEESPQRAAVENQVGTAASTREIEIEGTRVMVTGVWRVAEDG